MRSDVQILRVERIGPVSASVVAVELEEVALRTHIGGGNRHCVGYLTLEAEAPVDVLRRASAKVRVVIRYGRRGCRITRRFSVAGTE